MMKSLSRAEQLAWQRQCIMENYYDILGRGTYASSFTRRKREEKSLTHRGRKIDRRTLQRVCENQGTAPWRAGARPRLQ